MIGHKRSLDHSAIVTLTEDMAGVEVMKPLNAGA